MELAKRAARSNKGTQLEKVLSGLADELEGERRELRSIMDHLGVSENRIKVPVAWAAEKVGRLKPNGHLTSYSPLSRVIELEGLALGITGKLALWRSLESSGEDLSAFDLSGLIAQAEAQRDEVEQHRIAAARDAFSAAAPGASSS